MENNKKIRDLYELYIELGHDAFEAIIKPMELYLHNNHASSYVISMISLNAIVANAMENCKLGEIGRASCRERV